MDVGAPSNFERIRALYDDDIDRMRAGPRGRGVRRCDGRCRNRQGLSRAWVSARSPRRHRLARPSANSCRCQPARDRGLPRHGASGKVPGSRGAGDRQAGAAAATLAEALARPRHSVRLESTIPRSLIWCSADGRSPIPSGPSRARCGRARTFPRSTNGTSASICRDWDEWTDSYKRLEAAVDAFTSFQGTLGKGPGPAAGGLSRDGRDGCAQLPRLVLRGAAVRRGSAQQRHQCPPAAGADSVRAAAAGQLMVQSRAARHSSRDRSRHGWTPTRIWPSTGSRSKACFTSRNTCSTRMASGCCRMRGDSTAFRTTATPR